MAETAASLLESAGSMSLLLANLIYLGQPLISGAVSTGSLQSIAQVLENPFERQAFATFLRESSTSGTAT